MSELSDPGPYIQPNLGAQDQQKTLEDASSNDIESFRSIAVSKTQKVYEVGTGPHHIDREEFVNYSKDTRQLNNIKTYDIPFGHENIAFYDRMVVDATKKQDSVLNSVVDNISTFQEMRKEGVQDMKDAVNKHLESSKNLDLNNMTRAEQFQAMKQQMDLSIKTAHLMHEANMKIRFAMNATKWISSLTQATVKLAKSIVSGQ